MTDLAAGRSYRDVVTRSVYWQAGGRLAGQALSWVVSLFVVRILSPTDYGLAAIAGLVTGLLAMVAELGIGASAVQVEKLDRERLRNMASVVYLMHGAAFLLTFLLAPLVAFAYDEPGVEPVMRGLSAMFLLMAVYVLPESLLERDLRFQEKTTAELAATLTSMLTALGIALAGGGVWALVGSILMLHLTKAVLFNVMVRMPLMPRWSAEAVRPFVRYGSIVMFAQIAHYLFSSADVAIGGRVLGKELLGLYVVTLTVVSVPLDKFMPAITKVSFAAFSRIQTEPDRVVRNVLRGVRLSSLLAFPFYFGLAVIAPECIPLILGDKWAGIVAPLQILCLAFPLRTVAAILPPALYAVGRPGTNLGNVIIALAIMSVAFLLGVRRGVNGLALAWGIAYPLVFLISSVRALRALGVPARSFAGAILPAAFAGALMGGAVALLRTTVPIPGVALQVGVLILVGTLAYAAVLFPLRRYALADLEVVFRRGARAGAPAVQP